MEETNDTRINNEKIRRIVTKDKLQLFITFQFVAQIICMCQEVSLRKLICLNRIQDYTSSTHVGNQEF